MWANAQRDGRPALFNAAKSGWRPLLECRAVTLPRRETRWNLQGCLKLVNRSQPLVGRSSPYCGDMWRTYCCLTICFPIVDTCVSCEDIARQVCATVPRWRFLATFLHPVFSASRVQQVSDLHLKFALSESMADIQCAAAEIRLGKKERRKKEEQTTARKYNGVPYSIGGHQKGVASTCVLWEWFDLFLIRADTKLIRSQHNVTALHSHPFHKADDKLDCARLRCAENMSDQSSEA